jgi:hypothetical protein
MRNSRNRAKGVKRSSPSSAQSSGLDDLDSDEEVSNVYHASHNGLHGSLSSHCPVCPSYSVSSSLLNRRTPVPPQTRRPFTPSPLPPYPSLAFYHHTIRGILAISLTRQFLDHSIPSPYSDSSRRQSDLLDFCNHSNGPLSRRYRLRGGMFIPTFPTHTSYPYHEL